MKGNTKIALKDIDQIITRATVIAIGKIDTIRTGEEMEDRVEAEADEAEEARDRKILRIITTKKMVST